MRESLKYLGKAEGRQASDMAEMTERRIGLIELFVRARKALQVRENEWTDRQHRICCLLISLPLTNT